MHRLRFGFLISACSQHNKKAARTQGRRPAHLRSRQESRPALARSLNPAQNQCREKTYPVAPPMPQIKAAPAAATGVAMVQSGTGRVAAKTRMNTAHAAAARQAERYSRSPARAVILFKTPRPQVNAKTGLCRNDVNHVEIQFYSSLRD